MMKVILVVCLAWLTTSGHGFLSVRPSASPPASHVSLFGRLQQNPGESDMNFIKRMTNTPLEAMNNNTATATMEEAEEPKEKTPRGKYQRVEEWDAERNAKGEMSWEERVQFDGQRFGNQVRQNDILGRNLHSF